LSQLISVCNSERIIKIEWCLPKLCSNEQGSSFFTHSVVTIRLVVLKSGLGLKSGLKSTFAGLKLRLGLESHGHGLGLGLESHGLGLGLKLGDFFSKSSDKSTSYKVINRQ